MQKLFLVKCVVCLEFRRGSKGSQPVPFRDVNTFRKRTTAYKGARRVPSCNNHDVEDFVVKMKMIYIDQIIELPRQSAERYRAILCSLADSVKAHTSLKSFAKVVQNIGIAARCLEDSAKSCLGFRLAEDH